MPKCKGCDTTIEWILIDGKRIPLDTRKHAIYTLRHGPGGAYWARDTEARISHFATCPAASTFSKSKRKEPIIMSPSFSRFSSSTIMTIFPARKSAIISSIAV